MESMIKTYLVPVSGELIKAMEKGEAPSFLHCATCLDGLTNGEVIQKMFPNAKITEETYVVFANIEECNHPFDKAWWNRKWGE